MQTLKFVRCLANALSEKLNVTQFVVCATTAGAEMSTCAYRSKLQQLSRHIQIEAQRRLLQLLSGVSEACTAGLANLQLLVPCSADS